MEDDLDEEELLLQAEAQLLKAEEVASELETKLIVLKRGILEMKTQINSYYERKKSPKN